MNRSDEFEFALTFLGGPEEQVLRGYISALETRAKKLEAALRDAVEDAEGRWDMTSPSTNPGIKHWVTQGRKLLG